MKMTHFIECTCYLLIYWVETLINVNTGTGASCFNEFVKSGVR